MTKVFVQEENGKIVTLFKWPNAAATREADSEDADVLAFLAPPPPPTEDEKIDASNLGDPVVRGLVGAIAEFEGITRGQVVAAMKRNARQNK